MANNPSIPPLFCSTPPPIDFGDEDDDDSALPPALTLDEEDDDEFGDFAVASQSNEDGTNADVPSLPRTPVHLELSSSTTTSGFDDMPPMLDDQNFVASFSRLHSADDKLTSRAGSKVKPVEAFNLAILESNTPPPLDLDETVTDSKDDADEEVKYQDISIVSSDSEADGAIVNDRVVKSVEFDTKDEDNVSLPSLKLDTLSISSEKQSACSSLAEEDSKVEEIINQHEGNKTKDTSQPNNATTLPYECENTDVVKLEDLEDDSSDDECYSPKKRKNLEATENSTDFFAIHAVAEIKETSTVESATPVGLVSQEVLSSHEKIENIKLESAKEDEFDDFAEFADFQSTPMPMPPETDEFDTNKELQRQKPEFIYNSGSADLNTLKEKNEPILQTVSQIEDVTKGVNEVCDEDDFDDFQDFTAAPLETVQAAEQESVAHANISAIEKNNESENDDEFGDFEEAQFSQPISQIAPVPLKVSDAVPSADISQNPVCISNLNDRLKTVLEMMFPSVVHKADIDNNANDIKSNAENDQSILKFDSIDTAKALSYQWINSEVRHSLIKSLGIDSRNILYGEKWNSSMPRFAANLSFNPLEPMKPQQVSHSLATAESSHPNSLNERTGTNTVKPDVPAVEFDWNSSGLVNPLDGSKEITHTRETETVHQTQSGQSDATVEQQQQQQTLSTLANDDDDDISKLAIQTASAFTNTTTAASTILNTTTTAALSSIISSVGISNDNDDSNTTGDNNININEENQYKTTESLANNPNVYSSSSNNKETDNHNTDEVITTSTFAGPLKETHIYTPSKSDAAISKATAVTKTTPIDFDYEIAAAGIIIDETVIKKEYRDIVYNPGFNLEFNSGRSQQEALGGVGNSNRPPVMNNFLDSAKVSEKNNNGNMNVAKLKATERAIATASNEFDDEFSDFQSVPPLPALPTQIQSTATVVHKTPKDIVNNSSCSNSRTSTPTFGGVNEMILSPAILLPQAISMESNSKPKIVWGDTSANINPDELARIEELFPQPKTISAKNTATDNSQRSTPTRSIASGMNGYQQQKQQQQQQTQQHQLSISASIAQKELNVDDDDWTEFVSVPVNSKTQNFASIHNNNNQNNNSMYKVNNRTSNMPAIQQQQKQQKWQQPTTIAEAPSYKTNVNETSSTKPTNDEEWSDFVSSTPAATSAVQLRPTATMLPQFNSAAWQNANFYNNPLSFYQSQNQTNVVPKVLQNNNSSANNYNNNYQQYYAQQQQQQQQQQHFQLQQQRQQQQPRQQQIHIMQDFSTAPPYNHRTLNATASAAAMSGNVTPSTNSLQQFQLGSAKVAPSISLIPDFGFVAPAAPTHTAFINSLPKPSFSTNTKK